MALQPIKNKVLVFVIVLVTIAIIITGYHFWSISRRLHPSIEKYHKISLDVSEIKKKADSGMLFSIVLGEKTVQVTVKPKPVFHKGAEVIEQTEQKTIRRKIENVTTYAGTVVGPSRVNVARLTITKDILIGYIFLDDDW